MSKRADEFMALVNAVQPYETTRLSANDEKAFRQWAAKNRISDVDNPDARYDYRGYWLQSRYRPIRFGIDHFPDTFKQHGHPTFSRESQYSTGVGDGGTWSGEQFNEPSVSDTLAMIQSMRHRMASKQ